MIGLPNWSNVERVARFGEYLELVGLLLSQEVTPHGRAEPLLRRSGNGIRERRPIITGRGLRTLTV
jgi:hypothetical protein